MQTTRKNSTILVLWIVALFLILSCGTNRNVITNFDLARLRSPERNFEIENGWSNPLNMNRINLIDNPNYVRMNGDSVSIFLPYFGVRHMGGGYNADNGIRVDNVVKNLKITDKRKSSQLNFTANSSKNNESYQFMIEIFENGNTYIVVNSSQRSTINYQGKVIKWE